MNMNLREVICTSKDGDRFWKLPSCYIRGSAVKYLRLPPELLQKAKDQGADDYAGRGGGRGKYQGRGGRGRGRGGRGGRGRGRDGGRGGRGRGGRGGRRGRGRGDRN